MNHLCPGLNYPGAHALQHGVQIPDVMSAHPIPQQSRCVLINSIHIYTYRNCE